LYGRVRKYLDENEKLYDMRTDVPKELRYYSKDQIFVNYSQIRGISDAVWTYFFRREVVLKHKIYFEDKLLGLGEDIIYITKFLNHTNNLVAVPKAYYIWNARTSHSHTYYKPKGDLEGKILGLKKERKLMKKHKVDKLNPKFYVKRLASYGSHIVATNHKIGKAKYELELKNYQKLHEMFKPYYDELNHLYPDIPESVQAYLILNKHYKALFNYMKFGIKAKEKLSNATNSLNNKHKIK
ncbi:MAG: hypothetical protein MJ189_05500, partial [Coriobacteriales bacterium]|nr:hypothetical protein [Coriobacteriales bacterium]